MANNSQQMEKFLPEVYLNVAGKNIPALKKALNQGLDEAQNVLQSVIDQLFLSTASGKYLVSLGAQEGFVMPTNSGLDIRSYRVLVPIMVSSPKQVRISVNELLQAFYGSERVRPNISSDVLEPYSLEEGDDIIIETNKGVTAVSLTSAQIRDFSNVSAQEIAAILNAVQTDYQARAVQDRATGRKFLRIISSVEGNGSFIRVAGGKLQNVLQFPQVLEVNPIANTIWNIQKDSYYSDLVTFTWNGEGSDPQIYNLSSGDVVTIRGFSGYLLQNGGQESTLSFNDLNGSYEVIDAGYDYFKIKNATYLSESGVDLTQEYTQTTDNNIVFTSKKRITLFDQEEYAYSSEISPQTITITIPAVPPILKRFLKGSAHLKSSQYNVLDFTRNTLQIEKSNVLGSPLSQNRFVISSDNYAFDAYHKKYKTNVSSEDASTITMGVVTNDETTAVLPYTSPQPVGEGSLRIDPKATLATIEFPYRHGLLPGFGFTLQGFSGLPSDLTNLINKEHFVHSAIDEYKISFFILRNDGKPIKANGEPEALQASVYRYDAVQSNGADFYIQMDQGLTSTLRPGDKFYFTDSAVKISNAILYNELIDNVYTVISSLDGVIDFYTGLGSGSGGLIFSSLGISSLEESITSGVTLSANKIIYAAPADNGMGGNGMFFACCNGGFAYSADGKTWMQQETPGYNWKDVTYRPETISSSGIYVLVGSHELLPGENEKCLIVPESDLANYQFCDMTSNGFQQFYKIAWSPSQGVYVSIGSGGTIVSTNELPSVIGDWNPSGILAGTTGWKNLEWIEDFGYFVAQDEDGLVFTIFYDPANPASFPNGLVVDLRTLSFSVYGTWSSFAYSPDLQKAVMLSWNNMNSVGSIAHTDNAESWVVEEDVLSHQYDSVSWSDRDQVFVATGPTSFAAYSSDGINWTEKDTNLPDGLNIINIATDALNHQHYAFESDLSSRFYILDSAAIDINKTLLLGDSASTYHFDKNSETNQNRLTNAMRTIFLSYKPPENPDFLGPYLYDPNGEKYNFTISQYQANISNTLLKGATASVIEIDTNTVTEGFPSSGYFLLNHGKSNQEGPIRYAAISVTPTTAQLIIDASYRFKNTHGVGSQINFLHQNITYVPTSTGNDYPFYLTGTASARDALFELVELLVAAGIFVESDVNLPNLRNEDQAIAPFE